MSILVRESARYWAIGLRFPRWEPSFRDRLLAEGIDPFRPPPYRVPGPVDLCVNVEADGEFAARERLRRVLPELDLDAWAFPVDGMPLSGLPDPLEDREPGQPPWVVW
jgi:hypothetical protein